MSDVPSSATADGGTTVHGVGQAGRFDLAVSALAGISRAHAQRLISTGRARLDDRRARASDRLRGGEAITVELEPAPDETIVPESIPLRIAYEDASMLIVDKPAGLVVHPSAGHAAGTLVHALLGRARDRGEPLGGIAGVQRPGIVHRLDKDTTGLMVVAKTDRAHQALAAQFADHGRTGPLERAYLAFVWGVPANPKGTIDAPLGRHPRSRDKVAVRRDGRPSITHWQVLERFPGKDGKPVVSLIECRLETGRTHQIRAHMAYIGHPLLGDPVYGPGFRTKAARLPADAGQVLEGLGRQALHAYILAVQHPTKGQQLQFRSELPVDLARLHDSLTVQNAPPRRPKKPSRPKG